MNENNVLPPDFDGIFRFTNATDEDFVGRWAKVEYTFPAMSTTPMIISGATPEDVQHIRKKFAKELAEREFYKGTKIKQLDESNKGVGSVHVAVTYQPRDLEPYIQQCLKPLPIAQIKAKPIISNDDEKFTKDARGRKRTRVLDKEESLVGENEVIA